MSTESDEVSAEADDQTLHELTDQQWRTAHEAQFGAGSTIPDEQLAYVWEPGRSVDDLGGADSVVERLGGGSDA